ncbi:hypothetical protein NMG60_11001798 [Bertholletia excelsa]
MTDNSLNLDLNLDPQSSFDTTKETVLMEELNHICSENKKLTEMLIFMWQNYNTLQSHFKGLVKDEHETLACKSYKRTWEGDNSTITSEINGNTERFSPTTAESLYKRPKQLTTCVSTAHIRIDPSDDSLIVKDGYQWRKYGQKVTRDNPSPRAYYKCSCAPSCPMKKKVQKSIEDPSILVAVYEGEHNHPPCEANRVCLGSNQIGKSSSMPISECLISSNQTMMPLIGLPIPEYKVPEFSMGSTSPSSGTVKKSMATTEGVVPATFQVVVEQLANSLASNSSFTSTLAAAISSKILDVDVTESWETN